MTVIYLLTDVAKKKKINEKIHIKKMSKVSQETCVMKFGRYLALVVRN